MKPYYHLRPRSKYEVAHLLELSIHCKIKSELDNWNYVKVLNQVITYICISQIISSTTGKNNYRFLIKYSWWKIITNLIQIFIGGTLPDHILDTSYPNQILRTQFSWTGVLVRVKVVSSDFYKVVRKTHSLFWRIW